LDNLKQGVLTGVTQDATQATYAAKLNKVEAQIDWSQNATYLERAIRAYNPVPVANTVLNGITIKIWQASISEKEHGEPGVVLAIDKKGILVGCGAGALCLEVLQRPNGKSLPANQFVQGFPVRVGDSFTAS